MKENKAVKIDIVGGFLGAGKTTFLNKLIADGLGAERIAIIENEFGQEPIDDSLFKNRNFEMRTLASGCICCTLKADFVTSITDLVEQIQPDRILIEPTGLASPNELDTTCNLDLLKRLAVPVVVNSMTTIVNAEDAAEMIEFEIPVYLNQLDQARLIVLSRTQNMTSQELEQARQAIRSVAEPDVVIEDRPWDEIDGLEILALAEHAYAACNRTPEDHGHAHGHAGFSSVLHTPTRSFDQASVDELVKSLDDQGILRAKGFLQVPEGGMLHFEYVFRHASVEPTDYSGAAKLVVIGQNLDQASFPILS